MYSYINDLKSRGRFEESVLPKERKIDHSKIATLKKKLNNTLALLAHRCTPDVRLEID
jgi:hypothetical protein